MKYKVEWVKQPNESGLSRITQEPRRWYLFIDNILVAEVFPAQHTTGEWYFRAGHAYFGIPDIVTDRNHDLFYSSLADTKLACMLYVQQYL